MLRKECVCYTKSYFILFRKACVLLAGTYIHVTPDTCVPLSPMALSP